jgi:hypothetical protein
MSQSNISTSKYFKNKKHAILNKKKKEEEAKPCFPYFFIHLPCLSSESYPLRGSGG